MRTSFPASTSHFLLTYIIWLTFEPRLIWLWLFFILFFLEKKKINFAHQKPWSRLWFCIFWQHYNLFHYVSVLRTDIHWWNDLVEWKIGSWVKREFISGNLFLFQSLEKAKPFSTKIYSILYSNLRFFLNTFCRECFFFFMLEIIFYKKNQHFFYFLYVWVIFILSYWLDLQTLQMINQLCCDFILLVHVSL